MSFNHNELVEHKKASFYFIKNDARL